MRSKLTLLQGGLETEHDIQHAEVESLRKWGFVVKVTSNRRHTSNTKGLADVFVHVDQGLWLALEFKTATGRISAEQAKQIDAGMVRKITKRGEALEACIELRRMLRAKNELTVVV